MAGKITISTTASTLKNYKEILIALIFFTGIAVAAVTYYAPLTSLIKLECALESQRLLAIQRDQESMNSREIITSQNQERMLMDLIVLLSYEEGDSKEIQNFKKNVRDSLYAKAEKTRTEITSLMVRGAQLSADVVTIETQLSKKECPNEN